MNKECRCCGRSHDRSSWNALAYVGQWDDGEQLIELRNCACGSTLAVLLGDSPTRETLPPEAA